jgi:hypothetical protein
LGLLGFDSETILWTKSNWALEPTLLSNSLRRVEESQETVNKPYTGHDGSANAGPTAPWVERPRKGVEFSPSPTVMYKLQRMYEATENGDTRQPNSVAATALSRFNQKFYGT